MLGLAVVFLLVIGMISYGVYLNYHDEHQITQRLAQQVLPLTGEKAKVRDIKPRLEVAPVYLSSGQMADAVALINGRIVEARVDKNEHVSVGDVLFVLHMPELTARLKQADSNVLKAETELLRCRNTYRRYTELRQADAVSAEKYDEVESAYHAAQADLEAVVAAREELLVQQREQQVKAARRLGCEAKGYRWTAEKLKEKSFPLILHWEFNHFVVLEGFKEDTACLNDPASGRREVPWESFRTSYTGIALEVRPGESFRRAGKPYSIVAAVAKKLMADRAAMFFLILINLGLVFPGLATPVFHRLFIDDILSMKHDQEWMFNLVIAMVVAVVLLMAMTALRLLVLTRWQNKLTVADSSDFFWHVLRLPMQFFQQRFSAEIASRIAFNESIAGGLSGSAATALLDFFVGLFFLMLLLQYSVPLTVSCL